MVRGTVNSRQYKWEIATLSWVPDSGTVGGGGDATAANQTTGNASLASIDGKLPALSAGRIPVVLPAGGTGLTDAELRATAVPISAASLPLPTGAATQATLASSLTELQSILAKLNASLAVTGTFFQAVQPISDNAGSLTVDAPVGTPAFVRLSDGVAAVAPALETTLSALNGKVTAVNTGAVTIAAALPAGTNNIGDVDVLTLPAITGTVGVNNFPATQPVSMVTVPTHEVTSATAINFKSQSETYQGGVAVSQTNPLHTSDYDAELGLAGGHTNLRDRLFAQRYTVLSDSIADGLATFWTSTVANGGTTTVVTGEGLIQTSANAIGSAQLSSTTVTYYPGQSAWLNSAIRFGDTGSVGNIRRIGAFTVSGTTPQDGFYYELTGTTLNAVSCKGGVATAVASGSWTKFSTAPFTLTTNYHQFEIRFTSNSCQFYIDNVLRHTASGGASSISNTLNFPITLQSINTSGATNRVLAVRNIGMGRFGNPDAIKDSTDVGRTAISLSATAVTAGTSGTEAMISFTRSTVAGGATSSASSFVIPIGKTFRITAIMAACRNMAATTASTIYTLRINTAGAAVTTSNAAIPFRCATPATINSWDRAYVDILDGIDIAGNGVIQFGMSVNPTWTTTASQYDVNIIGYEYTTP